MKKVIEFLCLPFLLELAFFLGLLLMSGSADLYFWSREGDPVFGLYMFAHSAIMCYGITLIVCSFKNVSVIRNITKWIFCVLGVLNLILDSGVHSIMGYGYTGDMTAIIMGTNMSESKEFVGMYFNWLMVGFLAVVICILVCIIIFRKPIKKLGNTAVRFILLATIIAFIGTTILKHSKNWEGVFLMKIYSIASYKTPVNLTDYSKMYPMEVKGEQPDNVVLIIGESLKRSHMGNYGYRLNTTPCLDSIEIIKFSDMTASSWGTISSFKTFMSANDPDAIREDWYLSPNLLDVIKSCGYSCTWISNQSPSGAHDNIVAKFSELADSVIWCGNKHMGIAKKDYDEILLPEIDSCMISPGKNFMIIHMMGSHENFCSRYPKDFDVFKTTDYAESPENQRQTLAEYDNSVLYNDWVVAQIIKRFEDKEAVVIYFPDHALDVFDTDSEYAGHARTNNPESIRIAKEIPFIVYVSPSYKNKFPDVAERINSSKDKQLRTDKFIYTAMDLMNCDFRANPVVDSLSMFRK